MMIDGVDSGGGYVHKPVYDGLVVFNWDISPREGVDKTDAGAEKELDLKNSV